ncbi:MAG TPA: LON peptidase substrate-binding domain-containing protein [Burkholderiales bacterium]|nr:LON peptidase substrate-binding domain-containing protein [Burkholderiales bacterium]
MAESVSQIHIFTLNTVLFPDGLLPLKVFEQRYLELVKTCLREERPFGVCLIREGREVGQAAVPEPVGCLATIVQWDMPQLGVFHLLVRGGARFRIRETWVAPNQLISAAVEPIPPDPPVHEVDALCREVLAALIERLEPQRFPAPARLDDPAWVGYRLAELLPLELAVKQQLLEMRDAGQRLARLRALLAPALRRPG